MNDQEAKEILESNKRESLWGASRLEWDRHVLVCMSPYRYQRSLEAISRITPHACVGDFHINEGKFNIRFHILSGIDYLEGQIAIFGDLPKNAIIVKPQTQEWLEATSCKIVVDLMKQLLKETHQIKIPTWVQQYQGVEELEEVRNHHIQLLEEWIRIAEEYHIPNKRSATSLLRTSLPLQRHSRLIDFLPGILYAAIHKYYVRTPIPAVSQTQLMLYLWIQRERESKWRGEEDLLTSYWRTLPAV